MLVLAAMLLSVLAGLFGVVELWRRRSITPMALGVGGLAASAALAFSAELWFALFGIEPGDGQIFIGYYLIAAAALCAAVLLAVLAGIVLLLRPRAGATHSTTPDIGSRI